MWHDGTSKQTNGNDFRGYGVINPEKPPAAENRPDGILRLHL